jgi:hypothetical protein
MYTTRLGEPLCTDVELDPRDMEQAVALAQAYKRRPSVVAELPKGASSSSTAWSTLPHTSTTWKSTPTSTTPYSINNAESPTAPPTPLNTHTFKCLTPDEVA